MLEILDQITTTLIVVSITLVYLSIYSFELRYEKRYNYIVSLSFLTVSIAYVFETVYEVSKYSPLGIFIWLIFAITQFSKARKCTK